jgi:hypothetical protein
MSKDRLSREERVDRFKNAVNPEIVRQRQHNAAGLEQFMSSHAGHCSIRGRMSEDVKKDFRELVDRAYATERLCDYLESPEALLEYSNGAYQAHETEDGRTILTMEKIYIVPDAILDAWTQDAAGFLTKYMYLASCDSRVNDIRAVQTRVLAEAELTAQEHVEDEREP